MRVSRRVWLFGARRRNSLDQILDASSGPIETRVKQFAAYQARLIGLVSTFAPARDCK